ncbi:MAG: KEOPS complex subunit Pcc1 [Halanaeroarchaeum sp.]
MTRGPPSDERDATTRRVTVRTTHDRPALIADAVAPDNTDEMDTRVEDGTVVTTIERGTTGGLGSTVDDYVVNLDVASQVAQLITDSDTNTDTNQ